MAPRKLLRMYFAGNLDHQLLARLALSALCVIQGVTQLAIDTGRTHATNPVWARHARFHVVWQSVTVAILSGVELALLWYRGFPRDAAFYLAVLLAAVSPLAFFVALATRKRYDGALSDPNGMRACAFGTGHRTFSVDLNVVAISVAVLALAAIVVLYQHSGSGCWITRSGVVAG